MNETHLPADVPLQRLLTLSTPEKVALIGALWSSIDDFPADSPAPDWQLEELSKRLEEDEQSTAPSLSWDEVVDRLRSGHEMHRG